MKRTARKTEAHLDCFHGVRFWLEAQEAECAAAVSHFADAHPKRKLPEKLADRWFEIQVRKRQLQREMRRFQRRHRV